MSQLANIEVIGSDGCPYVQRVVTYLIEKQIPFSYKNVDLKNKPDWFLEKSPLGKVPVLRFPDGRYIFESTVINEFLDDSLPEAQRLSSPDPLVRALNRSWIEFAGSIFTDFFGALQKTTQADFESALATLPKKFEVLDKEIKGPYFNGDKLSLIDIALAPLFLRVLAFDTLLKLDIGNKKQYPKVHAYVNKLREIPALNTAALLQNQTDASLDPTNNIKGVHEKKVDPAATHEKLLGIKDMVKARFATGYASTALLA